MNRFFVYKIHEPFKSDVYWGDLTTPKTKKFNDNNENPDIVNNKNMAL